MKKKIISMYLAVSMFGSVAFANEPLDIWQESEGLEYSEEIQMEVTSAEAVEHEMLPLEILDTDESKSDRFIVKYKESAPETINAQVTILVVLVLPCVPAIPIVSLYNRVISPRKVPLSILGIFNSFARIISGLLSLIAAVYMNKSMSSVILS